MRVTKGVITEGGWLWPRSDAPEFWCHTFVDTAPVVVFPDGLKLAQRADPAWLRAARYGIIRCRRRAWTTIPARSPIPWDAKRQRLRLVEAGR